MPIDPFKDYTLEEQRALNLLELFDNGLRDENGKLRLELQGIGSTAAAIQAQAQGIPPQMIGRLVTSANEISLAKARAEPQILLEELEKRNHPEMAKVIKTGLDACQTDEDYRAFVNWLGLVRNLLFARTQQP